MSSPRARRAVTPPTPSSPLRIFEPRSGSSGSGSDAVAKAAAQAAAVAEVHKAALAAAQAAAAAEAQAAAQRALVETSARRRPSQREPRGPGLGEQIARAIVDIIAIIRSCTRR